MSLFKEIFPSVDSILEMEPEELAVFLLNYLNKRGGNLNRYNFSEPNEVADIIHIANQLLRIVNSIKIN